MFRDLDCGLAHAAVLAVALAATSCAPRANTPPPQQEAADPAGAKRDKPIGTAMMRELTSWDRVVNVARADPGSEHALGGYAIDVDGSPLWPPSGPDCEGYARCCSALAAKSSTYGMSCQLAIAKRRDCKEGGAAMRAIVREQSDELPAACE